MDKETGGGAAFPGLKFEWDSDENLLRIYAAIHLRIPDSEIDWLDEMIVKAERRDIAVKLLQGDLANSNNGFTSFERAAEIAYEEADAMIVERAKGGGVMDLKEAREIAAKWRRLSKEIVIDIPAQAAIILDDRITELGAQRDELVEACKELTIESANNITNEGKDGIGANKANIELIERITDKIWQEI